jgi:hypothetical protein
MLCCYLLIILVLCSYRVQGDGDGITDQVISIFRQTQIIYDRTPKIRLFGTGLEKIDVQDISIEVGALGFEPLIAGSDFTILKDNDGDRLFLMLKPYRRYCASTFILKYAYAYA